MMNAKALLKEAYKYAQEAYDFVSQYVFEEENDDSGYFDAGLEGTVDEYVDTLDTMHVLDEQLYDIEKLLKSVVSKVKGDNMPKGEMKRINKAYSILNSAMKYARSQYNKVDTPDEEYKSILVEANNYMSKVKKSLESVINN